MELDTTIRISDVIAVGFALIAGLGVFWTLRIDVKSQGLLLKQQAEATNEKLESQRSQLVAIQLELSKLTDVMVELGRNDERLLSQDRRIAALELARHAPIS